MKYKVTDKNNNSFVIEDREIANRLFTKVFSNEATKELESTEYYSEQLIKLLSLNEAIHLMSLSKLCFTFFKLGYYYHSFLTKQKVEQIEDI